MKAVAYYENGSPDVLKWEEIEKPVPQDDEVLIKIRAASVNPLDWRMMRGGPLLVRLLSGRARRRQPGVDVAGEVEAVGKNVTRFKPGDAVFGFCKGAFAEYVSAPEQKLTIKPESVTFEQAASSPVAALTALQGLRDKARVQAGQHVLINGAAGGVGTFAVQFAKWLGAEVTGVCSTTNVEMVRSIGADHVIDYTQEDFTKDSRRFDTILDCILNHPMSIIRRVLTPKGRWIIIGAKEVPDIYGVLIKAPLMSLVGKQQFIMFIAKPNSEDLRLTGELMATGKLTPVIDKCYSLREVREAMRYAEQGHVRGKLVINVEQPG